ncbi:hypothetical protein GCM10011390_43990 [Aureimonas endophytica]|uniref:NrS-1 polymerase-like helicase domain-containing protein n=1 Tax=Aureimonas endophytica TaxID=2027858 RepID=A0A917EAV7_9HYPH|nr:DUF5906 domain-containing protein [Aureimonas endophytica]GGE19935.1 hypothetical protein GCM10011390_43990 [Aureimonas endophytica]
MDTVSEHHVFDQPEFGDLVAPRTAKQPDRQDERHARISVEAAATGVEFLRALDPDGWHNLVAINPMTGHIQARTFAPGDWSRIDEWIRAFAGELNIYYSANEPIAGAPDRKLGKSDIGALRAIFADVDPADGVPVDQARRVISNLAEMLQGLDWRPTFSVDTGGGAQFIWRLKEKLETRGHAAWAEAQGRAFAKELRGDDVFNIDRILRLPGPVNIPPPKKVAKGRTVRQAVVTHRSGRCYEPSELSVAVAPIGSTTPVALDPVPQDQLVGDIELIERAMRALPNSRELFPHRADMIRIAYALRAATAKDPGAGLEILHEWAERWEGGDYDPDVIEKEWASLRPPFRIGAPLLFELADAHGDADGKAVRHEAVVARWFDEDLAAAAKLAKPVADGQPHNIYVAPDDIIERINRTEAIAVVHGKTVVIVERNEAPGRQTVVFSNVRDRLTWYANQRILRNNQHRAIYELWLEDPRRRQYSDVVFEPAGAPSGAYNLWRGFVESTDPGARCDRFLEHLRAQICRNEPALFEWLIGWLAQMVQQPAVKPGVAVVLRGGRGVGKSIVGQYVGAMCPMHHVTVAQPKHLLGSFNDHLKHALLIQVEEAFWAGDKKLEGPLKNMVTSDVRMLEGKHLNAHPIRDCARLLITSNERHVVPAGVDERRWAVFDVGEAHKQDHGYFAAIMKELKEGGAGALRQYLEGVDLSNVNVRQAPDTGALLEEKIASLSPMARWLLDCLTEGHVESSGEWPTRIEVKRVYQVYSQTIEKDRYAQRLSAEAFGHQLRAIIPEVERKRGSLPNGSRPWFYELPHLDLSRQSFCRWIKGDIQWDT